MLSGHCLICNKLLRKNDMIIPLQLYTIKEGTGYWDEDMHVLDKIGIYASRESRQSSWVHLDCLVSKLEKKD